MLQSKAVGPSVWVSTSGNDTTCVRGDQTKPCATFLKAYQIALCGDTITINNGSYSGQSIGHLSSSQNGDAKDCSSSNNPVIFQGQSQAGVTTGGISIGEPWVTLTNMTMTSLYIAGYDSTIGCYTNPVVHVTVQNSVIDGQGVRANPMGIDNAGYISLLNNTIGNIINGETEIHNGANCAVNNNHITLSGNTWHDFINTINGSVHMECLQIDMGAGGAGNSFFNVSGNKFLNCGQYDIFTSGPQHDMTYQNNWFDNPCSNQGSGCSSLASTSMGPNPDGSGDFYNIVVTFNSYKGDALWPTLSLSGTIIGNIIAYNIFPTSALDGLSSRCGSLMNAIRLDNYVNGNVTCAGDVKKAVTYVSPGPPNYNFDLAGGSAGIDALSPCPAGAPATDIHGTTRPQGSACDVGADETLPVPNVWLSTTGNDTTCVRGDQTKPCLTPAKAWQIANSGDIINASDGDYLDGCTLTGPKASDTSFIGTAAARFICTNNTNANPVFAHHLHFDGIQHLVISGITIGRISSEQTSGTIDHNTIKDLVITCQDAAPWPLEAPGQKCSAQIQLVGNDWLFDSVSVGPSYDSGSCGGTGDANKFPITNSLFKNVTFHDQRYQRYVALPHTAVNFCNTGVDAQHTENIFMTGSNGLTFDGLVITNGTNSGYVDEQGAPSGTGPNTGALFLTSNGGSTPSNLTIRNCMVLGNGSTFSGGSSAPLLNTLIENCTLPSGAIFQCDSSHCPGGYQSLTLRNNIFGTNSGICPIAAALGSSGGNMNDHNLFVYTGSGGSASQCGNTNLVIQTGFSTVLPNSSGSTLTWDLHLKSGSLAIDNADPLAFASTDKDGVNRPQGSGPDIGAYEYILGSSITLGDLNSDGHVTIVDLSILLSHYGTSATASQGDINNDGICNIVDLSILLSHYGS